eukprot:g5298.t1
MLGARHAPISSGSLEALAGTTTPVALANMNTLKFNGHIATVLKVDDGGARVCLKLLDGDMHIKVPVGRVVWTGLAKPGRHASQSRPNGVSTAARTANASARRMLTLDTACSRDLIARALGPDGFGLPVHLIRDKVLPFFLCHRVTNFSCSCASSSRGDFPLSAVTNCDDQQWWISGQDNFKLGSGREWLEFKLGDGSAVQRVSAIGVKIPPLPFGPLSVRQFHVEYKAVDGTWMRHPGVFETLDHASMQWFALLPPIDTHCVRVVCTLSAVGQQLQVLADDVEDNDVAPDMSTMMMMADTVGLFQVLLE